MNAPDREGLGEELDDTQKQGSVRARIEANWTKRLTIAEAMKEEAGVVLHEVNKEDLDGLAFLGTGRIKSPAGKNMRELWTVAHECGHIYLHSDPEGWRLPTHVKELEAESYAHQAFIEHGMKMPRLLTQWGRHYVGSWVEKDRAAGLAIDPRAEAYARGERSPYEQLRYVPTTWTKHNGLSTKPMPSTIPEQEIHSRRKAAKVWIEIKDWARFATWSFLYIGYVLYFGLKLSSHWYGIPGLFDKSGVPSLFTMAVVGAAALWGTNVLTMWRVIRRT